MDLSEKIKLILSHKNTSPSIFADEIGIQRSSMSHILAGRNKPSLDIVQKIIRRYPDLGINWILDGEELEFKAEPEMPEKAMSKQHSGHLVNQTPPVSKVDPTAQAVDTISPLRGRTVEKIVIFYSDGTFQEFKS